MLRLDSVYPPAAKIGTEVDVALVVADGEAKELHFSHPGLRATWKEKGRFTVSVAPEVPVGEYEVCASGSLGLSNPRSFVVGSGEHVVISKAAPTPADASEIKLGSVVLGRVAASANEHFRISLKKAQRVLVQVQAQCIDSKLRPVFEVIDRGGRRLQAATRDGLVDYTAAVDGDVFLRLHDLTFSGGADYVYRLSAFEGPFVDFASSVVLQGGGRRKVTLYGRLLPQGKVSQMKGNDGRVLEELEVEVDVPTQAARGRDGLRVSGACEVESFKYRLQSPAGLSNPVVFAIASASPVLEQEPNAALASATKFAAPAVLGGRFYPAGDVDVWSFEGKKGDVWRFEVLSHRLGLPTNPFLLIQKDGKDLAEAWGADTDAGGKLMPMPVNDPSARVELKEDGLYTAQVRDLSGVQQASPASAYALFVRKESADFRLAAAVQTPPEVPVTQISTPRAAQLRAGGTLAVRVLAFRRDGFSGDIELCASGLPPGVSCVPTRILAGKNEGYLLLAAEEKLEPFVGEVRIFGKAEIGGAAREHDASVVTTRWLVPDSNVSPVESYMAQRFVLGVTPAELAPVQITPGENAPSEVKAGGKLEVPLKVVRRGEFKDVLKLKAAGAPGVEAMKEIEVDAKSAAVTAVFDTAALKLPVGRYSVYFTAFTKGKFRGKDTGTTVFSSPVAFEVKAAQ